MNFEVVGILGATLISLNLLAAILYNLTRWPAMLEWVENIYED